MPAQDDHPTPYPDVNDVLLTLLSDVQAVMGGQFVGMYLYGSLASGDFDPQRSDIDFLVVTSDELPAEMIQALEKMHARITATGSKWAKKLEGAYIPQQALRRFDPNEPPCPYINEGDFRVGRFGSDWIIQRHTIREHGLVVAGPNPQTLIDPVQPRDLRRAVLETLRDWWEPMLQDRTRLHTSEYQAFAILTMCRALYTLEHGTVVPKSTAARWAQETLGERWTSVIERALAWRPGAQMDGFSDALDLIRGTLERSQQLAGAE